MPRRETGGLDTDRAREIAEECYDDVLAYCRRHAPARQEAADLAQETFLRFVRAKGYRERGKPIAYLMRIARSVCVDASRERRLETVSLDALASYKGFADRPGAVGLAALTRCAPWARPCSRAAPRCPASGCCSWGPWPVAPLPRGPIGSSPEAEARIANPQSPARRHSRNTLSSEVDRG